jgi:hypothetical protein
MQFLNAETRQSERQLDPRRWFDFQCTVPYRLFDNVQLLRPSSDAQLAHAKGIPTDANALSGVGDFFDDDLRKVTARFSERRRC